MGACIHIYILQTTATSRRDDESLEDISIVRSKHVC